MRQVSRFLFLLATTAIFFTSCSNDDDIIPTSTPLGAYENGYFILNEGGFSVETSGVDFVNNNGTVTEDVFRIENPDEAEVGSFLQNIFFDDTRAFIISGLTSSVTVVNRYTFEYITTIDTNFENPRYGIVLNGKAYITNRADFGSDTDDYITIVDLSDFSTTTVATGVIAERIVKSGSKLVISNGGFASGNTVTIVDIANNNTLNTLDLGTGNFPNSIVSVGNTVYALTGTKKFVEIDVASETISATTDLPASLGVTNNLQIVNDEVYFVSGSSVYNFDLSDTVISDMPLFTYSGSIYGFGASVDKIFIGDAGDFSSNGNAFEYSLDGDLLKSISTSSFNPNGFYFN